MMRFKMAISFLPFDIVYFLLLFFNIVYSLLVFFNQSNQVRGKGDREGKGGTAGTLSHSHSFDHG